MMAKVKDINIKNKTAVKAYSSRQMFFINIFGWYGVVAYQVAYLLVSFHILSVDDISYQLINLTGGLGLFVISVVKRAYQPAVSNLVWSLIATFALINILMGILRASS